MRFGGRSMLGQGCFLQTSLLSALAIGFTLSALPTSVLSPDPVRLAPKP
jgi:hypothetical protein